MTHNDVLRRIRYIFDFSDEKVISLFALAGRQVSREEISAWLKRDEDPTYRRIEDQQMATFLNGLITDRRGKQDGPPLEPEKRLNNNLILKKLKIALNYKAEDICAMTALAGLHLGKSELSAFFRKPGHKHYRECRDQVLRNFLKGLQIKLRGDGTTLAP